jgi:hypothetical protein
MPRPRTLLIPLAVSLLATLAWAEKVDMSPEELVETATHIVDGQVVAIYERKTSDDKWANTSYLAEVRVNKAEKGDDLEKDDLVYIRYWHRNWIANRDPEPNTNGHRGLPAERDNIRVYLARNAYNGFGESKDGGFDVIGANGFEILKPAEPAKLAPTSKE